MELDLASFVVFRTVRNIPHGMRLASSNDSAECLRLCRDGFECPERDGKCPFTHIQFLDSLDDWDEYSTRSTDNTRRRDSFSSSDSGERTPPKTSINSDHQPRYQHRKAAPIFVPRNQGASSAVFTTKDFDFPPEQDFVSGSQSAFALSTASTISNSSQSSQSSTASYPSRYMSPSSPDGHLTPSQPSLSDFLPLAFQPGRFVE
eukprot:g6366.t1